MGTASAAISTLSGRHLSVSMLVIVMPCCSTSLAKGTSQTNEQARRYSVIARGGLVLVEMATLSYVHIVNHLMVMEIADHGQIILVIVFQLMIVVKTCSLTGTIKTSQ
jgi:hypothetical protein